MGRFFLLILVSALIIGCADKKQKTVVNTKDESVHAPYDTIAIDSFSSGATSVDIAAQIRRSSIAFQDSVKAVAVAANEAKKKAELERLKKEAEKKEVDKKEAEKKKETAKQTEAAPVTETPQTETQKN